MQHVARILEILPVLAREHRAPGTRPAHQRLEPAHLLHTVDFAVAQRPERGIICLRGEQQSLRDRGDVGLLEPREHLDPVVMAAVGVLEVSEAGVPRGEGVRAAVEGLGDDFEGGFCGRFCLPAWRGGRR